MRAVYTGHEALTFTDYTDLDTGKALRAEPGGTYDIAPASGRVIPEFPEPWFTPVFATGGVVTASAGLAGEGAASPSAAAPEDEQRDE